jgi:hypothetical protein
MQMKKLLKWFGIFLGSMLLLSAIIRIFDPEGVERRARERESTEQTEQPETAQAKGHQRLKNEGTDYSLSTTEPEVSPSEIIDHEKTLAVTSVKNYPEVVDAAVKQDGRKVSLVVIVRRGTSVGKAKQLGNNFLRMVKTFSKAEPNPGTQIGSGVFDYLIGIYTPDQKELVLGAKVRNSPRITW